MSRVFILVGCGLSLLSPMNFGIEGYLFTGPMLVPTLAAAIIILIKARPWAYLTAGILAALFPLFISVGFGVFGGALANPIIRGEYWATWMNAVALPLVLVGGIAGFLAARRGNELPMAAGLRAPQGLFAFAMLGLLVGLVFSGAMAAMQAAESGGGGYDFPPEATVSLATENTAFAPTTLTVASGKLTEISVENRDPEFHTFTYERDGVEYDHDILQDATAKFLVRFDAPGTVKFWCKPHSAGKDDDGSGMVGTITVT